MTTRISVATLALVSVFAGCRTETTLEPIAQFTLSPRDALLQEGMVLQLKPLVTADGPSVTDSIKWSTSSPEVALVDATGLLTAVTAGTTVVRAQRGTIIDSATVTVQRGSGASLVSAGNLTCGLTTTAGAVCWGDNTFGQTGTGLTGSVVINPTPVVGGVQFQSISASWNHACGVDTNGDIYCWGLNSSGQLGMGNESGPVRSPSRVAGGQKYVSVAAGGSKWGGWRDIEILDAQETCGLTIHGDAYCWGVHGNFASTGETPSNIPRPVAAGIKFASLSVGYGYVCGIAIDRRAYCWGNNDVGQLGRARTAFDRAPKPVEGDLKFEQIAAGGIHTCALTSEGAAYCWGANDSLQLGVQSTEKCNYRGQVVQCQTHPVAVAGGYKFTSLAAGGWPQLIGATLYTHSCGITVANDVVCWGWNGRGQVLFYHDDLAETRARLPRMTQLDGIKFRAVAAGSTHTCGITVDGRAYCWGARPLLNPLGPSQFHVGAMEGGFVFK